MAGKWWSVYRLSPRSMFKSLLLIEMWISAISFCKKAWLFDGWVMDCPKRLALVNIKVMNSSLYISTYTCFSHNVSKLLNNNVSWYFIKRVFKTPKYNLICWNWYNTLINEETIIWKNPIDDRLFFYLNLFLDILIPSLFWLVFIFSLGGQEVSMWEK